MLKTCPALFYTQMTGLSDSMKDTSSVSFLLHYAGCKNNDCFLIKSSVERAVGYHLTC